MIRELWYYVPAVPLYLGMIAGEHWLSSRRGRPAYDFATTISDLSCGLGQQVTSVATTALAFVGYHFVYDRFRLFDFSPGSWVPWVIAFAGLDFLYYWYHRAGHRVNAIWGMHSVHHQSEHLNFAVALRQPWLTDIAGCLFYWPLPLLGVPIWPFLVSAAFLAFYQVWMHTSLVDDAPPWGLLFNTPSHHRAHHSREARFRDCNFGATLILWDRLFGTFRPERAPAGAGGVAEGAPAPDHRYGIAQPYSSLNPLWAQLYHYRELIRMGREACRPRDRAKLWLMPPEWVPEGARSSVPAGTDARREPAIRFAHETPAWLKPYIVSQFAVAALVSFALLHFAPRLPWFFTGTVTAWAVMALLNLNALLEKRPWAARSEALRHGVLLVLALYLSAGLGQVELGLGFAAVALTGGAWFMALLRGRRVVSLDEAEAGG